MKWWVGVEEVRQRGIGQQVNEILMRAIPFLEPCPEVDDPRAAPAGAAATGGKPPFEAHARGARQFGCPTRRNLIARVQREQVRDVPMPRRRIVVILEPLLQLSVFADLQRWQLGAAAARDHETPSREELAALATRVNSANAISVSWKRHGQVIPGASANWY